MSPNRLPCYNELMMVATKKAKDVVNAKYFVELPCLGNYVPEMTKT